MRVCVAVAGQCCCACVDTCPTGTFGSLEGRNHNACWLDCTEACLMGCVLFRCSLIQHPHRSACRSAVNTVASLSPLTPLSRRLKTVCPSDRLAVCFPASSALCSFWPTVSRLSLAHFMSFTFSSPPVLSAAGGGVGLQCLQVFGLWLSRWPSILSPVRLEPLEQWECDLCQRLSV